MVLGTVLHAQANEAKLYRTHPIKQAPNGPSGSLERQHVYVFQRQLYLKVGSHRRADYRCSLR